MKMVAPAPAACALRYLSKSSQPPTCISTTAPSGMPAKSSISHAESDVFATGAGSVMSAAHSGAVTSPDGESICEPKSPEPGRPPKISGM